MGLTNIIDRRKTDYKFKKINAVVEATWHDNRVPGSDRVDVDPDAPAYAEKEHTTVNEAIKWAESFIGEVTLYIYDPNDGIYAVPQNA